MIKIGNCPDSWGIWFDQDDRQMDWNQYLDEVAEAGYRYTEIGPYGYMRHCKNVPYGLPPHSLCK